MASYCGTSDCRFVWQDFSTSTGTEGTDIIAEASAQVDAFLGNHHMSPPAPVSGTSYDWYIKKATALYACWIAADRKLFPKNQALDNAWWNQWLVRADAIMDGIRTGSLVMANSTAIWERGICPAIPAAGSGTSSGSQTAPFGICFSNCEVVTDYFLNDSQPVTIVVQLDGAGTSLDTQTFRWGYQQDGGWEQSGLPCDWCGYTYTAYGIGVRFEKLAGTDLANGWTWTVTGNPSRQRNYPGQGLTCWTLDRG